jgi:hypothetical protein
MEQWPKEGLEHFGHGGRIIVCASSVRSRRSTFSVRPRLPVRSRVLMCIIAVVGCGARKKSTRCLRAGNSKNRSDSEKVSKVEAVRAHSERHTLIGREVKGITLWVDIKATRWASGVSREPWQQACSVENMTARECKYCSLQLALFFLFLELLHELATLAHFTEGLLMGIFVYRLLWFAFVLRLVLLIPLFLLDPRFF